MENEKILMNADSKTIRDPIHGNISFSDFFIDLISTPEIQHLYNIKQLGLAHLVFPGAHHTRFEHSIGCYHMGVQTGEKLLLDKDERELIACAALLHDIGHGPFSHTLESILRDALDMDHVDLTEKLILGKYDIFSSDEKNILGFNSVCDVLEKQGVDQSHIVDIIRGNTFKKPYLSQLLNSTIDVDQLDYLIRDAYYTGVAYGMIDVERFLQTIMVYNNQLAVKRKGVGVIENILMARSLMYSSVYFHKTVRIAELMLSKAIELIDDFDPIHLFKMTDCELIEYITNLGGYQFEIATRLKYRKLFKQVFSISDVGIDEDKAVFIKSLEDRGLRNSKEREFEEKLGIQKGYVIVDVPNLELHQAEPRIDQTDIVIVDEDHTKKLDDFTPIPHAIKSRMIPDWSLMIITDDKYRDIVCNNAEKILFS